MNDSPPIRELFFVKDCMIVIYDDHGVFIRLADVSEKLLASLEVQRSIYKISPSGYGVHWSLIDEDISVNELVKNNS